jgi:flagellum-specific peptidoglycan hydrolase FlgJ
MALTEEEAYAIAKAFGEAAEAVIAYLHANYDKISSNERESLNESFKTLNYVSVAATTVAVGLAIDALANPAAALTNVINEAKEKIKQLQAIGRAIRLAAGLADLAFGIMARDPNAIVAAIMNLRNLITADLQADESSPRVSAPAAEPFSIDSDLKKRTSPLNAALIDAYFQEKGSPLAGIGAAAVSAAQRYAINATYILSHAIHETGWGKSRICQEKNNLFGWGAIDNDPYEGAGTFRSREDCIDYVMEKVNELYLTPGGRYFEQRACLGNKSYGMNVHYASDPLWGNKIARIALGMENWALGQEQPSDFQPVGVADFSPSEAQRILAVVELVNPEQPYYLKHDITGDGKPETFCNWFVADVLEVLGIQLPRYDSSAGYYPTPHPLYANNKKTKPFSASALYKYFQQGGDGKWREVDRSEAVALANQGEVVLPSISGHIALVIPGGQNSEVRIAQAGRLCGKNLKLEQGFGQSDVAFFCHNP